MKSFALVVVSVICVSSLAFAAGDRMGQGRIFLGSTKAAPSMLNDELKAQGLKQMDMINQYGVEITFPTFGNLNTGLRYTRRNMNLDEDPAAPATEFKGETTQDSMLGIARLAVVRTTFMVVDVYAGIGAASTKYAEKTTGQDGELSKGASAIGAAGVSLSLGFNKVYVTFEGGFESNKVDDLSKSGNLNDNVTSIDLSGSYFTLGLMFDGIPIFTK